jgi:hypothetical protein
LGKGDKYVVISRNHPYILAVNLGREKIFVGDVLLLSGRSVLARLIRMIEGTSFDHVAMVAPPNFDDPLYGSASADDRTDELWMCDVSFMGGRWIPLSAYEEKLEAVAVRRHLSPVTGVVERAIDIAQRTGGYAWDRMLYLTVIAATRWTHKLAALDDKQSMIVTYAFYGVIDQLRKASQEVVGERRVCTEILVESFDDYSQEPPFAHLGLYIPPIDHRGLLWWAAGIETFADFLRNQPAPPVQSPLDVQVDNAPASEDALSLIHELATIGGTSFAGVTEPTEAQLRQVILDGTRYALSELTGSPELLGIDALTDPRKLAWYLLDQIMQRRLVVTPGDLASTPTLVDVGLLDQSLLRKHTDD